MLPDHQVTSSDHPVSSILDVMDARWCYPDEPPPERRLSLSGRRLTGPSEEVAGRILIERIQYRQQLRAWLAAEDIKDVARLIQLPVPPSSSGPLPGRVDVNGYECAEAELGSALHLGKRTTQIRLDDALTLSTLPTVVQLLAAGLIDETRATAISRTMAVHLHGLSPTDPRWRDVEDRVTRRAPDRTAQELRNEVKRAVIAVDPELAEKRREEAKLERGVWTGPTNDGMAEVNAVLTAEAAAIVDTALTALADAARDAAARTGEPDQRTHQQRRADALAGVFAAVLDGRPLPMYPADFPHAQHPIWTGAGRIPPWLLPSTGQPSSSQPGSGQPGSACAAPGPWAPPWMPAWWEPPHLPTQQRRRPHLVITIHADTLAGYDDLPAELAG